MMEFANFTCRGRTLQLPPAEAALALRGRIEPSLKKRSAVFYWSHASEDTLARREAVCTKKVGWHLRSFGSHALWAMKAQEKCGKLAGVLPNIKRGELDSCRALSLADLPQDWKAANGVSNATRGAGWWRWKPYYLLRELRSVAPGDVVVHADYDLVLGAHPSALWCLGQNAPKGVATFHFPCLTDRAWTKREATAAIGATAAELDTATLYAGLLVVRHTPEAIRFLDAWLRLTVQGDLATDRYSPAAQDSTFVAHRHDQALLSLSAKRYGVKSYPMPTKTHDVRDVWAWEAGYCEPGFDWPLPGFRPAIRTPAYPRGIYITHYKELGHMHDSMRHCLQHQPSSPHLPLPDYIGSRDVLAEMKALAELDSEVRGPRAQRKLHWSPRTLAALPDAPNTQILTQERSSYEVGTGGSADCVLGTTYGGLRFRQRPYLWTAQGCRGIFSCGGTQLRCGLFSKFEFKRLLKVRRDGKDWLTVCSCDHTQSLLDGRHWRDGKDHAANAAKGVMLTYRTSSSEASGAGGAGGTGSIAAARPGLSGQN